MNQLPLDFSGGAARGRRLRERGIRDVTTGDLEALTGLLARVREVAKQKSRLTIDDVRLAAEAAGDAPPRHPNGWAALMVNAAKKGILRSGGYEPSWNPANHGRAVRVWISQIVRDGAEAA